MTHYLKKEFNQSSRDTDETIDLKSILRVCEMKMKIMGTRTSLTVIQLNYCHLL